FIFFCNVAATTATYLLSLHDALPISRHTVWLGRMIGLVLASWLLFGTSLSWAGTNASMCGADATSIEAPPVSPNAKSGQIAAPRSEEHTSELQSRENLVCRLLLEKKK